MKSNLSRSDPASQVVGFPSYQEALADSAPPETTAEAWLSRAAILDAGDTPAAVRAIRRRGSLTAGASTPASVMTSARLSGDSAALLTPAAGPPGRVLLV
jgi:hypothetical protein